MMRKRRKASIRERLTAIIMVASTVSVLLTTLTISVIGVWSMRQNLLSELSVSASIVGDRNMAALLFNDDTLAANNMQVFSARRSVRAACLYDASGKRFASYFAADETGQECPPQPVVAATLTDASAEVTREIVRGLERVGYIYIKSDLKDVQQYIENQAKVAGTVTIAVLVVSSLLAVALQRGISAPILSRAATAREVSMSKDYSVRAEPFRGRKHSQNNELAVLTDSFNSMLYEIGAREMQLKRKNVELEKARDAAEAASRAKSQFLANISHELRTPLNAIIGFSSILMNQLFGNLGDAKYLEYSRDINHSGMHLLDIINDILDLAKAEAGRLDLNFEEVHVARAVQKSLSMMAEKAEKGKVTLSSDVQKNLPALVADRLRLIQIMLNILGNGVKFTPEGGKVHVEVRSRETSGSVSHFVIRVTDTGIGMSQQDIDKAFQSFGQVDSGLNRKYDGAGLGLPLSKKLLELHGGTIELESTPGQGTIVTMVLPILPPGAEEAMAE